MMLARGEGESAPRGVWQLDAENQGDAHVGLLVVLDELALEEVRVALNLLERTRVSSRVFRHELGLENAPG